MSRQGNHERSPVPSSSPEHNHTSLGLGLGLSAAALAGVIAGSSVSASPARAESVTVSINGTWNGRSQEQIATGGVPLPATDRRVVAEHPGEPAIIGDMPGTLSEGRASYEQVLASLGPDAKVVRVDYSEGSTIAPNVDPAQVIARYSVANPYNSEGGIVVMNPWLAGVAGIPGPEIVPPVREDRIGVDTEICRTGDLICDNAGLTNDPLVNVVRILDNAASHSGVYGNRHGLYNDPALRPIDEYIGPDGRRHVTVAKPGDEVAPLVQEIEGQLKIDLPAPIETGIEAMVDHGTPGSTPETAAGSASETVPLPSNDVPALLPSEIDGAGLVGIVGQEAAESTIATVNEALGQFGIRVTLPE